MSGWKAASAIAAFELRREWTGMILTALFALYFGAIFTGAFQGDVSSTAASQLVSGLRDWMYLFGFAIFGCLMNRTIFAYWRDDPFTRRIAHWRTMPIPLQAILSARYLQSMAVLAITGPMFLILQYALDSKLRADVTPGEWIAVGIVWLSYGLVAQSGYIFMELGYAGKTFVKGYLVFCLLIGAICTCVAWLGGSIVSGTVDAILKQPIAWPIGAAAAACLTIAFGSRMTLRRMRNRRYTF